MVATASAQKRRSAAVERPDLLEAEQGTHGQERCQHVVNAKRRKGELASPSSACTAATPSASGVPSERHAAQAAHRESGPAGPGMCAAALPSTSGRQADAAVRGKPRRTHEIDALFSAKQRSPAKAQPAKPAASPQPAAALGNKDDLFGSGSARTRRRADGLPVYTADELGVDRGGGTADCPFDCACCF